MSLKDDKRDFSVESRVESVTGACGDGGRTVPDSTFGSNLDESVDNLSMEVHLGDDNSRHPSEISSVSYQNLLEDGDSSSRVISRRGSDDSLDSSAPDEVEICPQNIETFEACDLPLSEHFPMGALEKTAKQNSFYKDQPTESSSYLSQPSVKLKDSVYEIDPEIKLREKQLYSSSGVNIEKEEVKKRNSLEVRNNIPKVGEVKDYEKEIIITDLSKSQNPKSLMIGLKQSPGVARRIDHDLQSLIESETNEMIKDTENQNIDVTDGVHSFHEPDSTIEVITPVPKNINIENEYDYVKYSRVQPGNSYVGMRLAYSSSNDSLNYKQDASLDSSREPSPEKVLHRKTLSELCEQEQVNEEKLTEIPLNNSDYCEDKKAFTLSPENTECDSVEVESVTSEGENSTPGFPTVEDGLSSSQASDAEEGMSGNHPSPSRMLQLKQKAALNDDLLREEEEEESPPYPREMDAQAIMDDLRVKREALDNAIADIKTAIQRSKNVVLEPSSSQAEPEEGNPVWIKRDTAVTAQLQQRQDEMRRVREEIERQQTQQGYPGQARPVVEKDEVSSELVTSRGTEHDTVDGLSDSSVIKVSPSAACKMVLMLEKKAKILTSVLNSEPESLLERKVNTDEAYQPTTGVDAAIAAVATDITMNLGKPKVKQSVKQESLDNVLEAIPVPVVFGEKAIDVSEFDQLTKKQQDVCMVSEPPLEVTTKPDNECDSNTLDLTPQADYDKYSVNVEPMFDTQLKDDSLQTDLTGYENLILDKYSKKPSEKVATDLNKNVKEEHINVKSNLDYNQNNKNEEVYNSADEEDSSSEDELTNEIPELFGSAQPGVICGGFRADGIPRGYDSDDEGEEAEGMRYTRRNKGKKYAPLQNDDSLEQRGAFGGTNRSAVKPNGHMSSGFGGNFSGNNGNGAVPHFGRQESPHQIGREEHHLPQGDDPYTSEESSDIDAIAKSYARPLNPDSDTDEETDRLLHKQYQDREKHIEIPELGAEASNTAESRHSKAKEEFLSKKKAAIRDPDRPEVLIEGVLFRAHYLGSTQLISEGQPSKAMRMMQAQEAVGRIKAPEGENQPSTDVDLFISTEKIMVLNTDLQEIMMDHSLRTISYIADIGNILVLMARRRLITSPEELLGRSRRQAKILCHVFETEEANLVAQSIGQAFQVAYLEFLKANGIEDPGLLKEMDYQDVLNQQEIYGEELNLFANKDCHKEVIVPKTKNEPLGVVIVESGWGSMVPTVVLANMLPTGPAARCGNLNIGDQIISINGVSLVGLPLSACQTYIKASRSQTVVKLSVVPCPPVVEVLIKRPDVKYQLGFSVQNGVICSLLRGGIAERGGVRVGHRIIEINQQSVVAVPHEKIVTLLASSVGEIHMKTMPTSIYRLLTGQDVPHYL